MKSVLLSLVLLVGSQAHALVVGDYANYVVQVSGQNHTLVQTVTAISGDTFTVSTTVDGQAGQNGTGSIANLAQLPAIMANCTQAGGTTENVQEGTTTYATCHLVQNGEDIWVNDKVTFGIVKLISPQSGQTVQFDIQSYQNN